MGKTKIWKIAAGASIAAACLCSTGCDILASFSNPRNGFVTFYLEVQAEKTRIDAGNHDAVNLSLDGGASQAVNTMSAPPGPPGPQPLVTNHFIARSVSDSLLLRKGQTSGRFVLADFNNDGVPDTALLGPSSMRVTLYKADGSTLSTKLYPLPNLGASIVAADFNGDGVFDLALIQNGGSGPVSILILLGNGDGTFGPATPVSAGQFPFYLAAADLNGDGIPDLAVTMLPSGSGAGSVGVLIGKGDGSFAPVVTYPVGMVPATIVADDFNGDGKTDLVVLDSQLGTVNKVWTLLGKGDGTFQPALSAPTGTGSGYLSYADINRDGKLDLIIADQFASAMAIMPGNGDGTFQAATEYLAASQTTSIQPIPLQDGNTMLLMADNSSHNVVALFATSDGTVRSPLLRLVGRGPATIAAADLNGDSKPDLVITDSAAGNLIVKLGTGGGSFGAAVTYPLGSQPGPLALADVTGDGKIDALVADANGIELLAGKGDGTFAAAKTLPAGATLSSLVIADFNGDGKPDIAATDNASGGVLLFSGNGDGTFQPAQTVLLGKALTALTAATGDVNGDGKTDLIVAFSPIDNTQPGGLAVLLGKGDGTFQAPHNITLPGPFIQQGIGSASTAPLAVSDLNKDGKPDVVTVVSSTEGNQIAVYLGNGDGSFQPPNLQATQTSPPMIAITDVNSDGSPDLLLTDCCGLSEGSFVEGNGDGTFLPELHVPSGPSPRWVAIADLNGDGKPDAAIIGQVLQPDRGTLAIVVNTFTSFQPTPPTGGATTTTASPVSTTFSPNAQMITLNATVTSASTPVTGGTVTFTLLGTTASASVTNGTASVSFTIPGGTAAGNYALQAVYNPATGFTSSNDTEQLTISKATPVIAWAAPSSIVSGTVLGSTQLNATANVPGAFSYTPPSGTVLPVGNGQTLSVLFTPTDPVDYNTQTASVLINVTPAGSTTVTASNASAVFSPSNQTVTLSATLSNSAGTVNAGTVTFTVLGSSVSGAVSAGSASAVLTIPASTPANTYAIEAAYSGSGQFPAASDNTKTLTIARATPALTWPTPSSITSGTALGSTQLNATANVPGAFTYTPPSGTVPAVGNGQTLSVLFTPTDAVNYNTQTATVSISVTPAGSTTVTASNASAVFSTSSQTVTLSAVLTSNLGAVNAGTVTFTVLGSSVTAPATNGSASAILTIPANTSASAYAIQAAYSGSGQFPSASDNTKVLTIGKATPAIGWGNPADIIVGTALGIGQLNASANVPGVFTYTPPAGTVLSLGNAQTLAVQFVPSDAADYNSAAATVSISVDPMALTGPAQLVVTRTLTRDAQNEVVVAVTLTNTGGATAQGTLITLAKIGQIKATGIPTAPVDIASGAAVVLQVIFPANVGNPGTLTTLTLGGAYGGGSFNFTSRIKLP